MSPLLLQLQLHFHKVREKHVAAAVAVAVAVKWNSKSCRIFFVMPHHHTTADAISVDLLIIIYSTFSFCLNSWLGGTRQLSWDSTALSCLFYLDCSASGLWFELGLWCKWQWHDLTRILWWKDSWIIQNKGIMLNYKIFYSPFCVFDNFLLLKNESGC